MTVLADPTNYGNAPGNGPLRPGGVPTPENFGSQDQKNLPSTKSESAKRQERDLALVRDLEAGPGVVKDKGATYLPKGPREHREAYKNRLERAVFFNVFGHTARGLTGFVFRKDPKLGDDVPQAAPGLTDRP